MSLNHKNKTLWPIYITIKNLDAKIWQSQKQAKTLLISFISIIYKQFTDTNNKSKDFKVKIYYLTLKIILQRIYSNLFFINFKKKR